MAQSSGVKKKVWLIVGAMIMGMGIWSMHFIGMMAFHMRLGITYETPLLILSILASFVGSLIAFTICIQEQLSTRRLLISSITMGSAICSMHYLGMESMANVSISYDPGLFFLSFFIAAIASFFFASSLFSAPSNREKAGGSSVKNSRCTRDGRSCFWHALYRYGCFYYVFSFRRTVLWGWFS
nr:MHYT domain-containing protein [Bacillus pumilus]